MFWTDAKQGDSSDQKKHTLASPSSLCENVEALKTKHLPEYMHVINIVSTKEAPSLEQQLTGYEFVIITPPELDWGLSPALADLVRASKAIKERARARPALGCVMCIVH